MNIPATTMAGVPAAVPAVCVAGARGNLIDAHTNNGDFSLPGIQQETPWTNDALGVWYLFRTTFRSRQWRIINGFAERYSSTGEITFRNMLMVMQDGGRTKGPQTVSFDYLRGPNNTLTCWVAGFDSVPSSSLSTGLDAAGSNLLSYRNPAATSGTWLEADPIAVDIGGGYQYVMIAFQGNAIAGQDRVSIDNVVVTPEPAGLLLVSLAGLALLRRPAG